MNNLCKWCDCEISDGTLMKCFFIGPDNKSYCPGCATHVHGGCTGDQDKDRAVRNRVCTKVNLNFIPEP